VVPSDEYCCNLCEEEIASACLSCRTCNFDCCLSCARSVESGDLQQLPTWYRVLLESRRTSSAPAAAAAAAGSGRRLWVQALDWTDESHFAALTASLSMRMQGSRGPPPLLLAADVTYSRESTRRFVSGLCRWIDASPREEEEEEKKKEKEEESPPLLLLAHHERSAETRSLLDHLLRAEGWDFEEAWRGPAEGDGGEPSTGSSTVGDTVVIYRVILRRAQ
jgi:hypothetical protein